MNDQDKIIDVPLRLPPDHPLMQSRDHHVLTCLREMYRIAQAGGGSMVAPFDQLWRSAFELGVGCGTALKTHAELGKRQRKGKKSQQNNSLKDQ